MNAKEILRKKIDIYDFARKEEETNIVDLAKNNDFFMLEDYAKNWKRYYLVEQELLKIWHSNNNDWLNHYCFIYSRSPKMFQNEILTVLQEIKDEVERKI